MILLWGAPGDLPLEAVQEALARRGGAALLLDQRRSAETSVLLRVGEHRGEPCGALARWLSSRGPGLQERRAGLGRAGYVRDGAADPGRPAELTPAGEAAYTRLFAAREDRIARLLDGWQPEQHPRLLHLLDVITHELAASHERPGPDLDATSPAARRARPRS